MTIEKPSGELLQDIIVLEKKGYSNLIVSNFQMAEQFYKQYYELLRKKEETLPAGSKYHKGTPLHNWGISLISQNKLAEGFRKILLAYIEDLLDFPSPEDAFNAPAYLTLKNYPLIDQDLLNLLFNLAKKRRELKTVPRDPEELLNELPTADKPKANLSSQLSTEKTDQYPVFQAGTPEVEPKIGVTEILDQIAPKEKRVFVGGNHFNIVLLQHIKEIVDSIDDYKGILVADISSSLNTHDKSIEVLRGCSRAIFEISISNGHLMEIERATDFLEKRDLDFLLLYQGFKTTMEPKATDMLSKYKDKMVRYTTINELIIKINDFLKQ